MTYEEFCENYRLPPSEGGKQIFDAARRSVAAEVAGMFGCVCTSGECDRFLAAIDKCVEGE